MFCIVSLVIVTPLVFLEEHPIVFALAVMDVTVLVSRDARSPHTFVVGARAPTELCRMTPSHIKSCVTV